ncbi:hypothetical protein KUCAC02_031503 [Chaenocephalus aceratus]|nr:hypothetical protein KUCAC02_031503 [Chaenocephalus aceratus]
MHRSWERSLRRPQSLPWNKRSSACAEQSVGKRTQYVSCENNACQVDLELAWRSGIKAYQCTHLKSITYCSSYASPTELEEGTLTEMVDNDWFGEDAKETLPRSAKPRQM